MTWSIKETHGNYFSPFLLGGVRFMRQNIFPHLSSVGGLFAASACHYSIWHVNGFEQPVPLFLLVRFLIGTVLTNNDHYCITAMGIDGSKKPGFRTISRYDRWIHWHGSRFISVRSAQILCMVLLTGLSPITQSYTGEKMQFIVRDMSSFCL